MSLDPEHDEYGQVAYNHNYSITADTKLYGIWVPEIGRFTGARHVLSPSVSYTYAPEIDTVKKFAPHPLLGQTPYQIEQKTVGFGLCGDKLPLFLGGYVVYGSKKVWISEDDNYW